MTRRAEVFMLRFASVSAIFPCMGTDEAVITNSEEPWF